jgi:hypothetical protein
LNSHQTESSMRRVSAYLYLRCAVRAARSLVFAALALVCTANAAAQTSLTLQEAQHRAVQRSRLLVAASMVDHLLSVAQRIHDQRKRR